MLAKAIPNTAIDSKNVRRQAVPAAGRGLLLQLSAVFFFCFTAPFKDRVMGATRASWLEFVR